MRFEIVSAEQWEQLSEDAHLIAFDKRRPTGTDRIDYAGIAEDDGGQVVGYITVHEIDSDNLYWQFGGAMPGAARTSKVFEAYMGFIDWTKRAGYANIFTLIDSHNIPMLRLAMKAGFRIVGVRLHDGHVLVEHRLHLKGGETWTR